MQRSRRPLRGARGLEGGGGGRPPTRPGRGARQGPGGRGVVHRRADPRRHLLWRPKPPFTPGYELVGVVEELGPGCERLREGDRVGALTVYGADAERVCVEEKYAVAVPEDLDPAEVVSLIFPYMTAYQMLHRTARVTSGETVLMHGGPAGSARRRSSWSGGRASPDRNLLQRRPDAVERLGATWIDYRNEDFLARVRELTDGEGVDVVLDGIGGKVALRPSARLRKGDQITGDPGGRLVTMGAYNTMVQGRKSWRGWLEWWPAMAITWLWGTLSSRRRVSGYRVQILRIPHQDWFAEDFQVLLELLREDKIHPVVAERLPFSEARRAHEMLESTAAKGKLVLVPEAGDEAR